MTSSQLDTHLKDIAPWKKFLMDDHELTQMLYHNQ